ncbi:MAG: hypothetical protein DPW18_01565 [Chloroflexi bacterium]|nr:hypothetical protein [Chloroflexota bacterium]MDL1943703.1 DUF4365 domain-containing protein [Chloroflexi bacterium CFX2]
MPKIVRNSKFQELKGLDRIQFAVHEMKCLWRELNKDDIGIDGEIEILQPKPDGKGAIPTNKIIKVQAKSGKSYVKYDTADGFQVPVDKDDLEYWAKSNYPIIFIIYHPDDDQLYWKDIKGYVKNVPDVFRPPIKFVFDKKADLFPPQNPSHIYEVAQVSIPRVRTDQQEKLFSNLFLVQRVPKTIWAAPALTNLDHASIQAILRSRKVFVPPFAVERGNIYTLSKLENLDCVLREFCNTTKISSEPESNWRINKDYRRSYVSMLNRLLRAYAYHCNLRYTKEFRRFYFPKNENSLEPVKIKWTSQRTKFKDERTVAEYYHYGVDYFWRHLAAGLNFRLFGPSWFLEINPKYFFTTDGETAWDSEKVGPYTTSKKSSERNPHVLNHVLFWAQYLSQGKHNIQIRLDGEVVLKIEKMPFAGLANFAITDDPAIYKEPPEIRQMDFLSQFFSEDEFESEMNEDDHIED